MKTLLERGAPPLGARDRSYSDLSLRVLVLPEVMKLDIWACLVLIGIVSIEWQGVTGAANRFAGGPPRRRSKSAPGRFSREHDMVQEEVRINLLRRCKNVYPRNYGVGKFDPSNDTNTGDTSDDDDGDNAPTDDTGGGGGSPMGADGSPDRRGRPRQDRNEVLNRAYSKLPLLDSNE